MSRRFGAGVLLFLWPWLPLWAGTAPARAEDPGTALERGLSLYERDHGSREAQRLLAVASVRFPERHDVQLAFLDSSLANGDDAAVAELLRRLGPELDRDERFALDTVYCLLGHGRTEEARAQWNRLAARLQPSLQRELGQSRTPDADRGLQRRVAEVLFVQGLLTARSGAKAEALQLLRRADGYGFPPLDSPLLALAADSLFELEQYALAAQAYREILKHAPENLQARLRLGVSQYSVGQLEGARQELERLLRRAPGYPRAHYYLGAALLEQRRIGEAKLQLQQELQLDARCSACMAKLAYGAYLEGDDLQCESWLARASALAPDDLEASLVSGMLENRKGRYDLAIRHLTSVVDRSPGYTQAQYQLALAFERAGNAEKAREHRAIYDRLIQEQKARTIGVRGSEDR